MNKTVADLAHRWLTKKPENLTEAQSEVLQSAVQRRTITRDTNDVHSSAMSAGDHLADSIARIGGSWNFIISFLVFLLFWTASNAFLLSARAFDILVALIEHAGRIAALARSPRRVAISPDSACIFGAVAAT